MQPRSRVKSSVLKDLSFIYSVFTSIYPNRFANVKVLPTFAAP